MLTVEVIKIKMKSILPTPNKVELEGHKRRVPGVHMPINKNYYKDSLQVVPHNLIQVATSYKGDCSTNPCSSMFS